MGRVNRREVRGVYILKEYEAKFASSCASYTFARLVSNGRRADIEVGTSTIIIGPEYANV